MDFLWFFVSLLVILAGAEFFTNGVEWLGRRLDLGSGVVGSVLAAVGTALPETMVPIMAILFGGKAGDKVAEGAIIGAPFLLGTIALGVAGSSALLFHRSGRRKSNRMEPDFEAISRDLVYFIVAFSAAIGASFFQLPVLRYLLAVGLLVFYVVYLRRVLATDTGADTDLYLKPLYLPVRPSNPPAWACGVQTLLALGLIIWGAHLFVGQVESITARFGLSPVTFALIVAPIATELPEKFNSVIWIRESKDTLALGNISGAMVFQSTFPVSIGLLFTPWDLEEVSLVSGALAIVSALMLLMWLRRGKPISAWRLVFCAVLYIPLVVRVIS